MDKLFFKIIFFSFIQLIAINNSNAFGNCSPCPCPPADTVYDCYITDLYKEGNALYLKLRPVQFLWDIEAITEAKIDGVAEYNVDEKTKDTIWYMPNDYYINDEGSTTEMKIRISKLVKVSFYDQAELKKITVNELLLNSSYYKDKYIQGKTEEIYYSPYLVTVKNGKAVVIQETYIP